MFCAGLLLSIADLLNCVDCDFPAAGPQAQWAGSKQQHVPGSLPAATGTRGDNPLDPDLQVRPPSGADVCTIRRSAAHFNRKLPGNGAGVDTIEVPRADLRSNLTTGRFSECPSSGWRCGTRNLHIEFPEEIDAPLR